MDARRGEVTSIFQAGTTRRRVFVKATSKRRKDWHASLSTDAIDWQEVLRLPDEGVSWRIVYRIDSDAIVIVEVFSKKTGKTPKSIIDRCEVRLRDYDNG